MGWVLGPIFRRALRLSTLALTRDDPRYFTRDFSVLFFLGGPRAVTALIRTGILAATTVLGT